MNARRSYTTHHRYDTQVKNMAQENFKDHPLVQILINDANRDTGELPERAIEWAQENVDEARPFLLSLVGAATLRASHALIEGDIPSHAAELLGLVSDANTVVRLLDIMSELRQVGPDIMNLDPIWHALLDMDTDIIEPTVNYYHQSDNPHSRRLAALLLGDSCADDPEVMEVLVTELPETPCTISAYLAMRGDASVLDRLQDTIDACLWRSGGELGGHNAGQAMLDLGDAITLLGAELTAVQRRKYEQAWLMQYPSRKPPVLSPETQTSTFDEQRVPLTAHTITDMCEQALFHYGTVRKTVLMIEVTPALLWQFLCWRSSS